MPHLQQSKLFPQTSNADSASGDTDGQTGPEFFHRMLPSNLLEQLPEGYAIAQTAMEGWIPLQTWVDRNLERHIRPLPGPCTASLTVEEAIKICQQEDSARTTRGNERMQRYWFAQVYPERTAWYQDLFQAATGSIWPDNEEERNGRPILVFHGYRSPLDGLHYHRLRAGGPDIDSALACLINQLVKRHPGLLLIHY